VKIAYILNTYPQPSHSFIRRELTAIEAEGHAVLRLAMRRPTMPLVDPQDSAEEARTGYVLEAGALGLGLGLVRAFLQSPGRFWAAFRQAMRMGRMSEVGRRRHLIYLAEACLVARATREAGIAHMHAHFGTNAAAVACLAHVLGGPRYSFTVHGPEEFDAPRALSLGEKMAQAAFTVGVSSFGRSQLCRWVDGAHWARLHVIHCGIEPDRFTEITPVPEGRVRLVSIGRFSEQKGQLVLIAAMARLREIGVDAVLHLVGDGEMRGEIEAAIAAAGLQEQVVLTGWLDETGVRAELQAATAMVMPSFAEGLPMVIMEAMAAARPVIATYIAGIPELVHNGDTGWLVPAGDAHALADAVADLAETPVARLREMGQAGRARALARHDAAAEARKLLRLMEQAVG
jgi:glycosyltransferase involved in cell wall biosynthesis